MEMVLVILFLVVPFLIADLADRKGRSFGVWLFYAFIFTIPALIHALVMSKRSKRTCSHCGAFLLADNASRCATCGGEQEPLPNVPENKYYCGWR